MGMLIKINDPRGRIISPTGRGIRSDKHGSGYYHAPRGSSLHQGLDFVCVPGQSIVCPINSARVVRRAYPYADKSYGGVLLRNSRMELFVFYFEPDPAIFEKVLFQGDRIGEAQDVSKRYVDPGEPEMVPHIHIQINSADPLMFIDTICRRVLYG